MPQIDHTTIKMMHDMMLSSIKAMPSKHETTPNKRLGLSELVGTMENKIYSMLTEMEFRLANAKKAYYDVIEQGKADSETHRLMKAVEDHSREFVKVWSNVDDIVQELDRVGIESRIGIILPFLCRDFKFVLATS